MKVLIIFFIGFCSVFITCKSQNKLASEQQKLISDQRAYYPRVIKLANQKNLNGSLLSSFDSDGNKANFFISKDEGKTWDYLSSFIENSPPGHCCSGLYEVSEKTGQTLAGTLFWTTSIGRGQDPRVPTALKIYQSNDAGKNWAFLSNPISGNTGLWEAEFIINGKKDLVIYYSSEEHKTQGYNQLLAHKISKDGGKTWGTEVYDVAMNGGEMRPGMAIVRKLNNGKYIMCYEICGMGCDVFIRFSDDGVNWGDPEDKGIRVESINGNHFAHAPTITIAPDNTLIVIGQLLMNNAENKIMPDNGNVMMINTKNGVGPWQEIKSPVAVTNAKDDPCPNYSSQLILSSDNKNIIEIALQYNGNICKAYYNRLPYKLP